MVFDLWICILKTKQLFVLMLGAILQSMFRNLQGTLYSSDSGVKGYEATSCLCQYKVTPESHTVYLECELRQQVWRQYWSCGVYTLLPVITRSQMGLSALDCITLVTWLKYFYVIINYCKTFNWSIITLKNSCIILLSKYIQ